MNSKDIIKHELIGLEVKVIESKNKSHEGIKGSVVDETRNTLIIRTCNGLKSIAKKDATFVFKVNEHKVIVKGSLIIGRPEARLKKKERRTRWQKE